MKKIIFLFTMIPSVFLFSCSDPQDVPTAATDQVNVHGPGWNVLASPNFHGTVLAAKRFDASECRQCHGSQFDGGIVSVSCKSCHASFPHPSGWVGAGANSHNVFLKNSGYNLNSCKTCHGQNYATVKVNTSCLTCHSMAGGPEACNTCHGNFSGDVTDLKNAAPPKGLDDETAATTPAVGAHQAHFGYYQNLPAATTCQECHAVPANFAAAGHIDSNNRAELIFGALAKLPTEGGSRIPNVSYNFTNNTCSNSYCHGNWGLLKAQSTYVFIYAADKMEGSAAAPKWTDAATAACGTCHGLPPTGHNPYELTTCATCHLGVIDVNGVIVDKTKHVNGKVNVFGQEYPML
jgi:predicted CxxxxCH...CXXCH cytochrome family protein